MSDPAITAIEENANHSKWLMIASYRFDLKIHVVECQEMFEEKMGLKGVDRKNGFRSNKEVDPQCLIVECVITRKWLHPR